MASEFEDEQSEDEIRRQIEQEAGGESQPAEEAQAESYPIDDDDDDDDAAGDTEPERPMTRRERRQNRFREAQKAREEAERRAEEAERRNQELLRVAQARQQPPPQPQPAEDPHQAEIDRAWREQRLLYQEIEARGNNISADELQDYEQKVRKATETYHRAIARQEAAQASRQNPEQVLQATLAAQNADVYQSQRALTYARSYYDMARSKGRQGGHELHAEAMEAARREVLGRRKQQPTRQRSQVDRSRYAAPRKTGRSAGANDSPRTYTMRKEDIRMANELFSHIPDPVQRRKMFARTVGKDMLEGGGKS